MITNIRIKNFKALRDIDLHTSNLNVFTGLNGMGKSTILQALLLLRQSKKNGFEELILNDDIELGTFRDVLCESRTKDRTLSFELIWKDESQLKIQRTYENDLGEEKVLKGEPISNDFSKKALFGEASFKYLSAHRIKPQDRYGTHSTKVKLGQLGNEGEYAPHYYHLNYDKNISIKELAFKDEDTVFSLEYQVNRWLSVISPKISVHTESKDGKLIQLTYSYTIEKYGSSTSKFSPKNAGFGLTYVFSVLVALLSAKKGDIIIIENPESHIHPKGQTELARLMALAAKNGVQIFCETHSDHIVYGSRIAIKEREIRNEDVKIYYIDRDKNEHFSDAHWIEIDEYGRMERRVRKYFREFELHLNKLMS